MHVNLRYLLPQDTMETEELEKKDLEELPNLLKIGIFKKDGILTYSSEIISCTIYICFPIHHHHIME